MTDPDAPVPYWPVYYSPEPHVMDSVPGNYYPTPAAEAELDREAGS
jgi:hypothetical protein